MIQFLSIAFRNMKTVGTICPSSPMLSRELAESAITATSPKRVLEVGPGTGPVTKEILKSLRDGDVLDIVDILDLAPPRHMAAIRRDRLRALMDIAVSGVDIGDVRVGEDGVSVSGGPLPPHLAARFSQTWGRRVLG